MGEIKQTNFRIDQETADLFRDFCEQNGMNQAQGFDHVMQIVEMDRAKSAAPGRATEIEGFERAVKQITGIYLNSIEICNSAEGRAREQFASSLERQERTIDELQERITQLQTELNDTRNMLLESEKDKERAEKDRIAAERLKDSAEKTAADKQTIADTLASKLAEAETKAREYDGLLREFNQLKEMSRDPDQKLKDLQRDHAEAMREAERKAEREKEAALAVKQLELEELRDQLRKEKSETEAARRDVETARTTAIAELSTEHRIEIASMQERINELTDQLMDALKK